MKKLFIMALIAVCGFGSMSAQGGGRQRMSVEEQVSNLKKELNLTDEQTEKVTALYTEFHKKMKEAGRESRETMRSEREKLDKSVEALLTDEQKAAFEKMQANRRGGGGHKRQ